MKQKTVTLAITAFLFATPILHAQHAAHPAASGGPILGAPNGNTVIHPADTGPVNSYFYPSGGGWGGYFSPFLELPMYQNYSNQPNYWWVSRYPIADPRQDGYNPNSGYPPETVTILLLVTSPAKARITLDGVYIGTADYLGPTQLPKGEHSLRVEAPSYEAYETVLKVEPPSVQQLDVKLSPVAHAAKPAPRR